MPDKQPILENEWIIPITFLVCGILSVIHILHKTSPYWIVLAIVQFSLFFALVIFRSLRRSKIFPGILLCTLFGVEFVRSWHRYGNPEYRFIITVILGSAFLGSVIGLCIRLRENRQGNSAAEPDQITRLSL
jgi:peptidoglycan/LPS O-acetylase OafA/YrhL